MPGARGRPLKVGIMLPESERELAGATARWPDFLAMARRAEELGFDSVWFADHLLVRQEGEEPRGAWECWAVLAALAASTERIELGPFVCCTGYRNPALTAKLADTVDEISGGRLTLGIGAGWHEPEYRAFGFPFDHRVGRFDEAFAIIRTYLRDGRADLDGAYYQARDCERRPRGPRPAGPPLMVGTFGGPRMLRLIAEHADGWNVWATATGNRAAGIPPLRAQVDAACRVVGRDPTTLARSAAVLIDFPGATGRPGQSVPSLTGPTAELAEELRAYARAGIDHIQLYPDPCTVAGIEACAEVLAALDEETGDGTRQ